MLDFVFELLDCVSDGTIVLGKDGDGDDVAGDAAGTAQIRLLADVDIRNVFVLTKKRQVQNDLQRLGVSGEDNQVGDAAVQALGGLIGALLEELEVLGLVQQVEDRLAHGVVGQRISAGQVLAVISFVLLVDRNGLLDLGDFDVTFAVGLLLILLGFLLLLILLIFFVFLLILLTRFLRKECHNQVPIILWDSRVGYLPF